MTDSSKEPSKGAWTPGPWKLIERHDGEPVVLFGVAVEDADDKYPNGWISVDSPAGVLKAAERKANAKLIAAAPTMADLLRELVMLETPTTRKEIAEFVVLRSKAERLLTDLEVKP